MTKYWINENIVTPEGELMPKGFVLTIDKETAIIEVPSDIPGDKSNLYIETIPATNQTFTAHYGDRENTPVHVDDGELIGQPAEEYFAQFTK